MRLEESELVFYDYQWIVKNDVISEDKQYVSPFFGLDVSPHIQEAASFRFGLRLRTSVESQVVKAVVLLYVHYLDTLGIGVTDVECFINDSESLKLSQSFRDAQTLIFESQELFLATDNGALIQESFIMVYRIYPNNSMYGYTMDRLPLLEYGFEQCDANFGEEMWSAARKREWTDFEFVVNQTVFPFHRVVLAARCPALVDWRHLDHRSIPIVDTHEAVFEAFLYFLYTGQISLPVDTDVYREFVDLFIKYVRRIPDEIGAAIVIPSLNESLPTISTVNIRYSSDFKYIIKHFITHFKHCVVKIREQCRSSVVASVWNTATNASLNYLKNLRFRRPVSTAKAISMWISRN
jgi:hypothetical protein